MATVIVDEDSPVEDHGSVLVVTGTSEDGTQRIRFGGDHRPMRGLLEHVAEHGATRAEVEAWQITGTFPIEQEVVQ